nr:GH92 family glycosyl hydrolase [Coprobacter tertius]
MKHILLKLMPLQALLLIACNTTEKYTSDYSRYVDPFIGTGGHGHTFPGAVVPYGMIQPSPDTRIYQWDACSGYHYSDTTINGFSHTHLSGTGCGDYGDILLMPTVGEKHIDPEPDNSQQKTYASRFSHKNEVAIPGYYSVFLDRYGVKAEITSSKRSAIHRYTFPKSDNSGFIVDLDYSLQGQKNEDMEIEVISDTEIQGHKKTAYWAFDQYINFYAKFSKPFTFEVFNDSVYVPGKDKKEARSKVLLSFTTKNSEEVLVKIGISAVDCEGARKNVETEIPGWDFDKVRADAKKEWNNYLSKIEVSTQDSVQKTIFYTSMYHAAIAPNLFTDVDGRYLGMDLKIHKTLPEEPVYTVFSLWDTFRALHPLLTIIDPARNEAFIRSLIKKSEEGGIYPMWDLASNYTGTMIGYHAASLILDSYMKGYRDFDVYKAYQACLRAAVYDTAGIHCPKPVLPFLMPKAKYYKNKQGYIPCNLEDESVAKGLEYAYDDWCIAQLAGQLGDSTNYKKYDEFSKAYKKYFDPSTRFMRGLDDKGKWRTPFNPRSSNHRNDDYCEGTAWQWTWFVPQDIPGLVKLMGGRDAFIGKLDSLFMVSSEIDGNLVSADISGLIGQYAHGNEPSHHIIHLYNYVGYPWKTQQLVDSVFVSQYSAKPDGLSGNEDCGQMSAWFILNSIGFYQVCPGDPTYSIGRPLFDEVKIHLPGGKIFTVRTHNNSAKNKYVQQAFLNGAELDIPFFSHRDIENGGTLVLEMGDKPSEWGTDK